MDVEQLNHPILLMDNFPLPEIIRPNETKSYVYFNTDATSFDLSLSILSGDLEVYVGKTEDFTIQESVYTKIVESNKNDHLFLKIKPSDFQFKRAEHYFFLFKNVK